MGTTATALQTTGTTGARVCYVVAIEGLEWLLTDHETPGAVETAWSGTEWGTAKKGLSIQGGMSQKLEPYDSRIDVSRLSIAVLNEDLAQRVAATNKGEVTELLGDLDVDDTLVPVKSTAAFDSSGLGYCGIETFSYAGKTPTTFTTVLRGRYAPFGTDSGAANRFSRQHSQADINDVWGIKTNPKVTSHPRHWHGKWVGIWLHRIAPDGTLDTKAEAERIWAGRISEVKTPRTWVVFECEDARAALRDCVLGHNQWSARAADGMYFEAGWQVILTDLESGGAAAADTFEIGVDLAAGYYTADEFIEELKSWMLGLSLNADWSIGRRTVNGASRVAVTAQFSNTAGTTAYAWFKTEALISRFLGFDTNANSGQYEAVRSSPGANFEAEFIATLAPFRVVAFNSTGGVSLSLELALKEARGVWFDNLGYLPGSFDAWAESRDDQENGGTARQWGVVRVGDHVGICYFTSQFELGGFRWSDELALLLGVAGGTPSFGSIGIREDEDGEIEVVQVPIFSGTVKDLALRFFASTDGSGYNHATYDAFTHGFGAAIPWELLGDEFEDSVDALVGADGAIVVVLDEPTPLWDALGVEFLLRNAFLVWKDGTLRFTSWTLGNPSLAVHTFTEANKAGPADTSDDLRSMPETHRDWLANVVVIHYNRDATGDYRDHAAVRDTGSISDHGESKTIELEARNTYGAYVSTGDTLHSVIGDFTANVLPLFSRPVEVIKRTIDYSMFIGMAPGDIGTLTDDDIRDPDTGEMGVAGAPVLVIGVDWDWGGDEPDGGVRPPTGQVTLVLAQHGSRAAVYSPAAVVTSTSGDEFTLDADGFSEDSEDDDATYFSTAGEKVLFLVSDGTVEEHTVSSRSGNVVTMEGSATGSAGYLISDNYSDAVTTQRADCYQADDTDGLIEDVAQPYEWAGVSGSDSFTLWTAADYPRELGYFTDHLCGDGRPVSTLLHDELLRAVNNFVQHRSCQNPAFVVKGELSPGGDTWNLIQVRPFFAGPGVMVVGKVRYVDVAVQGRSTSGTSSIRVTISTQPPVSMSATTGASFTGSFSQATFDFDSTTLATATKETIPIHVNANQGHGYITIEAQTNARFYGLARAHTTGPQ